MQLIKQLELTNSVFTGPIHYHLVFRKDSYQNHLKFMLSLLNVQVQTLGKENAYKGLIVHNILKKTIEHLRDNKHLYTLMVKKCFND